ncbi:MAG TPA: hypothetical protein VMV94_19760, partial [Phycisphaerae bacterium]|nr:hypothetical protein [Phycisphaerae bacterium]
MYKPASLMAAAALASCGALLLSATDGCGTGSMLETVFLDAITQSLQSTTLPTTTAPSATDQVDMAT